MQKVLFSRQYLHVIHSRRFAAIRSAFNSYLIGRTQGHASNDAPAGRRSIDLPRRQSILGGPLINKLITNPQPESRDAVVQIEILHVQRVPTWRAVIAHAGS